MGVNRVVYNQSFALLLNLLQLAASDNLNSAHELPLLGALSAKQWWDTYHLAVKHAVAALAWDGIARLQSKAPNVLCNMPVDLMGKWFADVQVIEITNSRMKKQATELQNLLLEGHYNSQILKGTALAAYYPNPTHRQSADIDLWVRPNDSDQTVSLAVLRRELIAFLRRQPIVDVDEVVYHHIGTMIGGTRVELHVTPTWLFNPFYNSRLQRLFMQTRQFSPELQELYTLLHAFRHVWYGGITLRHVLDYYFIHRYNNKVGNQVSKALYAQLGLTPFAQAMDEVANYSFDTPISIDVLSPRARHLLQALPERRTSRAIRCDYPQELLFRLPWRCAHHLWRKANGYL